MISSKIPFYLLFIAYAAHMCVAPQCPEIGDKLQMAKIIPDLIDEIPDDILSVVWMDNQTAEMLPGTIYTEDQVSMEPNIFYENENGSFYTLIFTSPDGIPHVPPYLWLTVNIPQLYLHQGQSILPFTPPKALTKHQRFVFLAYEQPNVIEFEETTLPNFTSKQFCTRKFAEKYKFSKLLAANFFLLKH